MIENGEVVASVHNLRFTQSALEALRSVEAISRETLLQRSFVGGIRVPAPRMGAFGFSNAIEF